MNTIEVCLSPDLIHQHILRGKVVVVVDIFRATSCIVTGLSNGVHSFIPIQSVDECRALGRQGWLMAGEREGKKIEGFDLGNSPYDYLEDTMEGKKVAISTTNGSKTILSAKKDAKKVVIGSFLNLEATTEWLLQSDADVLIACSGWKGTVSLEDTLFAGALIDECMEKKQVVGDSTTLAHQLYINNYEDLLGIALQSSHAQRLTDYGIEKDLEYCLSLNQFSVLPILENDVLIAHRL